MKRLIIFTITTLLGMIGIQAQHITGRGDYLEGTSYISTSRIKVIDTRCRYAGEVSLSMDYVKLKGNGHTINDGEYYTIQMNFYERNIGQKVLLKCKDGKVIELKTTSLQRDPFVQIYWIKENKVEEIINGHITKIRIQTNKGFVDRDVKDDEFSLGVKKCHNLLQHEKKEEEKFDAGF
jgi:hypothetical protein